MRGGFCHNDILVRRLREVAEACGATVSTERPVLIDGSVSYSDLVIEKDGHITVCEPALSWRRVGNDRRKAVALGADLLLIATPDAPTAHACRRQLQRYPGPPAKLKVIVCPLGTALEILRATLTTDARPTGDASHSRKEA